MGQIQTTAQYEDATDLLLSLRPEFATPIRLLTVTYTRESVNNIDAKLSFFYGGLEFPLWSVTGWAGQEFVFPNADLPHPLCVPAGSRIVFQTTGIVAGKHGVIVSWNFEG